MSFVLIKKRVTRFFLSTLFLGCSVLYGQDIYLEPPDAKSGYVNINELTVGYGLGSRDVEYSNYFYGLTTVHGYEFNIEPFNIESNLSLCAGTGMLFYGDGAMFPVMADIRYAINLRKLSPFVFGNGGLLLNIDDIHDASMIYINGGLGTKIRLGNKLNLSVGTGLFMQFGHLDKRDTFANLKAGVTYKPSSRRSSGKILLVHSK